MGKSKGPFYSFSQLMGLWIKAGGDPGQAAVAAAIAMAESGGGVNSVNQNFDGSTDRGLWQINSVHGKKSTYDPWANAKAAVAVFNGAGHQWTPWSTYNNGAYLKKVHAGSKPSYNALPGPAVQVNVSGKMIKIGAGKATKNVGVSLNMSDLQAKYGFTSAMLKADSSLNHLFKEAVAGGWSDTRFQAKLMGTTWWRGQSDTGRQYWMKKFTDPKTASTQFASHQAEVNAIANDYGISMFNSTSQRHLVDRATNAVLNNGWNESQLRNYLASNIQMLKAGQEYGGKLGQFQDSIHSTSYKNGVNLSPTQMGTYIKRLAMGTVSMEQVDHDIRKKAASQWSAYKDQLMAGQDMQDIAAPYIKTMANLLELNEADIDMFDPMIRKHLQWKDPAGNGKAATSVPLWQFENTVRADARWNKTNNARDAAMTNVHKVLSDFGVAY